MQKNPILVGDFNPSEKYARQIGSFPQVGMNIKNIWNHQLEFPDIFFLAPGDVDFLFGFSRLSLVKPHLSWGCFAEKSRGWYRGFLLIQETTLSTTWMLQEVSKSLVNGL